MTLSISLIVLVIVLGTLAFGWSFSRRQQCKPALEPGCMSHRMPLPGKHVPALRTRLGSALLALSFAGLTLLLGPTPSAWAAVSHPQYDNIGPALTTGQYIGPVEYIVSDNNQYAAALDTNGVFHLGHLDSSGNLTSDYWSDGTGAYAGNVFTIMQSDGNFCVYKGTGPSNNLGSLWCARNTALPQGQYFAVLQDDGNLVLHYGTPGNPGAAYWSTGPAPTAPAPTPPPSSGPSCGVSCSGGGGGLIQ